MTPLHNQGPPPAAPPHFGVPQVLNNGGRVIYENVES